MTANARIGQLSPNTDYDVEVVAVNALSGCAELSANAFSDPVTFTTGDATVPQPPENIRPSGVTGGGIEVQWDEPFDNGGVSIDSYDVYFSSTQNPYDWSLLDTTTATKYAMAGLNPSTPYYWKLTSQNAQGNSIESDVVTISTTAPSAPGKCLAAYPLNRTGGMLNLTWDPPVDDGGMEVGSYIFEIDDGAEGSFKQAAVATNWFAAFGLLANTQYRIKIAGVNSRGIGQEGDIAYINTTEPSAPKPPADPQIRASTGGAVAVEFAPPADTGGVDPAEITYDIFADGKAVASVTYAELIEMQGSSTRRLSVDEFGRRLEEESLGFTVGSLDPSGVYDISVEAASSAGESGATPPVEAETTPATLPAAPAVPILVTITGGTITLSWDTPEDTGGDPISAFTLYQALDVNGTYAVGCTGFTFSCKVSGLDSDTDYWFYVTASNSVGESEGSTKVQATTASISAPGAPLRPSIVGLDDASIDITWSAPEDTGGLAINGYSVRVQNSAGALITDQAESGTTASISSLTSSTEYNIAVVSTKNCRELNPFNMNLARTQQRRQRGVQFIPSLCYSTCCWGSWCARSRMWYVCYIVSIEYVL